MLVAYTVLSQARRCAVQGRHWSRLALLQSFKLIGPQHHIFRLRELCFPLHENVCPHLFEVFVGQCMYMCDCMCVCLCMDKSDCFPLWLVLLLFILSVLVTCELICLVPASLSLSVFPRSLCAEGRRLSLNVLVQVQCIENQFSAAVTAILFHWIKWGQSSKSKDYTGVYKERDDTNILTHANTPADNVNNVFSCYVNSEVNKCGCSETVTLLCSV